ncbi:IS5 family transposase [Mesorhizobium hawassense]|uniref:IS5 family transposase n=1 Tax=Mesorhizobium hawassense TaxID=1209954 RepID=A0A330HYG6_9HYPH|nr:IS5 family transposase [Mesorhizobium hawassense]
MRDRRSISVPDSLTGRAINAAHAAGGRALAHTAPADHGPHKTIYNRFIRWSRLGVFNRILAELAAQGGETDNLMIDATHLKAHRTAASLLKKGALPRCIGRSRGGLTTRLQVVCDKGRPRLLHLSEGQANDHKTAAAAIEDLPATKALLADRAYSSAAFRQALVERGITPRIPPMPSIVFSIATILPLYRQRQRIENILARLKDWRRPASEGHCGSRKGCRSAPGGHRLAEHHATKENRARSGASAAASTSANHARQHPPATLNHLPAFNSTN